MSLDARLIDSTARETAFSGVVRVDRDGVEEFAAAYGLAHRAYRVPNTVDTRFATASATKGLTALAVVSLIEEGVLEFGTEVRPILGDDLPLIDDSVTVEHLLAHRSGIGDYIDEETLDNSAAYVLGVPVHTLATAEDYLAVLDGFAPKFVPGERFSYCNSGYVVLALIAERASRTPYHDLVRQRVCGPAGMADTAFFRSDALPARTATGYLDTEGDRTNVLHLPVRGVGDGGAFMTAEDVGRLWHAIFAGEVVPVRRVSEMVTPRSDVPEESSRYGLGFWLHRSRDVPILVGGDAGISFVSAHDPATGLTYTVLSNTSDGAWPVARRLREQLLP